MHVKKINKWIIITGVLFIVLVKLVIRPTCDCNKAISFLLGIMPNLIGSFLIPFCAIWFYSGQKYFPVRILRIQSQNDLRSVCIMGFTMLVLNEYLQLIPFFGRTFDYFDMIFSAVGLMSSYFVFEKIYSKKLYRVYSV